MGTVTQKTICFCSDPVLQGRLAGQGIGARVFDEILSREEKTAMLESLDCFASRWFLNEKGSDYTEYRGVSLGAALHDEVMIFFHLLLHFIYIIDKLGPEYKVVFYHSDSCLMPDPVIRFLVQEQVEVRRAAEKYPWISYKEQFERQAYSNFSRISFWPAGGLRSKQGQIKLGIKQMLSRIFYRMFHNPKRLLYFHAHRSLVDFYESFLSRDGNTFGICITDTTPLEPKKDKKGQNFYKDVCRLFRIARKGVMLDSLKCPFYYAWYRDYSRFSSFRGLRAAFAQEFRGQTAAFGQVRNKDLLRHFERLFEEFYAGHLVQCMKLVDFYYEKFSALKPYLCLQEMCHPFQAQVLSLLGIPCRMYPSNYIIHNQYFAPALFKKTGSFFKAVSFSRLDAERFRRLGFETANIHTVEPDLFRNWFEKIQPVHGIDTLKGKRVLILAPSIIALHTFRYQVQSSRLYVFFTDVFEVLS
jgi:hypothetical protein